MMRNKSPMSGAASMFERGLIVFGLVGLVACGDPGEPEVDAGPLSSIQQLSANALHSCAVLADGTARCWGENGAGQLGIGTRGDYAEVPLAVPNLPGVVQIAAGFGFSCAVLADSTARCWGDSQFAEVGNGGVGGYEPSPVVVTGLSGVAQLSAGGLHACALLLDGSVRCWGMNSEGEAGTGSQDPGFLETPAIAAGGLSDVAQISAGFSHTCALLTDGTARCWGANPIGEVGDGTLGLPQLSPVIVVGLADVVQISAGFGRGDLSNRGSHTCAVLADGTARCWGNNASGQLGDGTIDTLVNGTNLHDHDAATPVVVKDLAGVTQIAAGWDHTCALLEDSTVRCWGSGKYGQLGDGSTVARLTPVAVAGLSDVAQIVAGEFHTCALLQDGTARCWGAGPLGNRTTNASTTPVYVNE